MEMFRFCIVFWSYGVDFLVVADVEIIVRSKQYEKSVCDTKSAQFGLR